MAVLLNLSQRPPSNGDYLFTATTFLMSQFPYWQYQHRPQFQGPEGGRCTHLWLYLHYKSLNLPDHSAYLTSITWSSKGQKPTITAYLTQFYVIWQMTYLKKLSFSEKQCWTLKVQLRWEKMINSTGKNKDFYSEFHRFRSLVARRLFSIRPCETGKFSLVCYRNDYWL